MKNIKRPVAIALSCSIALSSLSGCGNQNAAVSTENIGTTASIEAIEESTSGITATETNSTKKETTVAETTESATSVETTIAETTASAIETTTDETVVETTPETTAPVETEPEEETETIGNSDTLNSVQRNSLNMLNYLTVLNREITDKSKNKMYMESTYTKLINNINPNAVDIETQNYITDILNIIEDYRLIDVKRDRIAFLHDQQKAANIRSAVPNPLSLLNVVRSGNIIMGLASQIFLTVDTVSQYKYAQSQEEINFLQSGWQLEDEAASVLHQNRTNAFGYMIDMVRTYNLPGNEALNEQLVDQFVEKENMTNPTRKIEFFENNKDTYKSFGLYWIALARSYYEIGDYRKCIKSIDEYEKLDNNIFRKDLEYAEILPIAIAATDKVEIGQKYVNKVEHYLEQLIANASSDDWASRYFAAQVYLSLYKKNPDHRYLDTAYELAKDNVNILIDEQEALNNKYTSELELVEISEHASKDEKKEIKKYNKSLKEARSTELPPVSEPLLLNCDLMFALADKCNISFNEQEHINSMLHDSKNSLFLSNELNKKYCFNDNPFKTLDYEYAYNGKQLYLPTNLISDNSKVLVTITSLDEKETKIIDDWTVSKVNRQTDNKDFFMVEFNSKIAKDYKYPDNAMVEIKVMVDENDNEGICLKYKTKVTKKLGFINTIGFEKVK